MVSPLLVFRFVGDILGFSGSKLASRCILVKYNYGYLGECVKFEVHNVTAQTILALRSFSSNAIALLAQYPVDNILFPILFVLRVLLGGSRFVEVPDFVSFQLQFFFEFCIRFLIVFIWPYTKKS